MKYRLSCTMLSLLFTATLASQSWAQPPSLTSVAEKLPADTAILVTANLEGKASLATLAETLHREEQQFTRMITIFEGLSIRLPISTQLRIVANKWIRNILQEGPLQDLLPSLSPAGYLALFPNPKGQMDWALAIKIQDLEQAKIKFGQLSKITVPGLNPVGECKSNLRNLQTALEMYSIDHRSKLPKRLSELAPSYLLKIPSCPTCHRETYSAGYQLLKDNHYKLSCSGNNHQLGKGLPYLTSRGEEEPSRSSSRTNDPLKILQVGNSTIYALPSSGQYLGWLPEAKCWCLANDLVYCSSDPKVLSKLLATSGPNLAQQPWFAQAVAQLPSGSVALALAPKSLLPLGAPGPSRGALATWDAVSGEMSAYLGIENTAAAPISENLTGRYIPKAMNSWVCGDLRNIPSIESFLGTTNAGKPNDWSSALAGPFSWGGDLASDLPQRLKHADAAVEAKECAESQDDIHASLDVYRKKTGRFPQRLQDLVPEFTSSITACGTTEKAPSYRLTADGFTLFCEGTGHQSAGLLPNQPYTDKEGTHSGLATPPPVRQIWIANVKQPASIPGLMQRIIGADTSVQTLENGQLHLVKDSHLCWAMLNETSAPLLIVAEGEQPLKVIQEAVEASQEDTRSVISLDQHKGAQRAGLIQCEYSNLRSAYRSINQSKWVALWHLLRDGKINPDKIFSFAGFAAPFQALSSGWLWDLATEDSFEGSGTTTQVATGIVWRRKSGIPTALLFRALEQQTVLSAPWSQLLLGRPNPGLPDSNPVATCGSNLKNLATALEIYSCDHAGKYPKDLNEIFPDYLRKFPVCPSSPPNNYASQAQLAPDAYTLNCSTHHWQYSSTTGLSQPKP